MIEIVVVRIVFVAVLTACAYFLRPFQADGISASLGGLALGGAIIVFERRVRQVSLKRLIGGAIGSVATIAAYPAAAVMAELVVADSTTTAFAAASASAP